MIFVCKQSNSKPSKLFLLLGKLPSEKAFVEWAPIEIITESRDGHDYIRHLQIAKKVDFLIYTLTSCVNIDLRANFMVL